MTPLKNSMPKMNQPNQDIYGQGSSQMYNAPNHYPEGREESAIEEITRLNARVKELEG